MKEQNTVKLKKLKKTRQHNKTSEQQPTILVKSLYFSKHFILTNK